FAAAERNLRIERELREHERAVEPEPRNAENRQKHDARFERGANVAPRRAPWLPVDREVGGGGAQLWNREAREEPGAGDADQQSGNETRACACREQSRDQRAEQNREERSALDHRVAADELR